MSISVKEDYQNFIPKYLDLAVRRRRKLLRIIFKDLYGIAQQPRSVWLIKTNQLMIFVCSEIHRNHRNILRRQNVEFLNGKFYDTQMNH